jgi:hypothetical protein
VTKSIILARGQSGCLTPFQFNTLVAMSNIMSQQCKHLNVAFLQSESKARLALCVGSRYVGYLGLCAQTMQLSWEILILEAGERLMYLGVSGCECVCNWSTTHGRRLLHHSPPSPPLPTDPSDSQSTLAGSHSPLPHPCMELLENVLVV